MSLQSKKSAVIAVALATLGLSLKGIWAKLAYAAGASVSDVLFYRALFSAPLVVLVGSFLARRERVSGEAKDRAVGWLPTVQGLLLGAYFSIAMFCDFEAIRVLGAGVSRVVLFGFPLIVLFLEAAWRRRFPSLVKLVGALVAWTGLALVCKLLTSEGLAIDPHRFGSSGLHWALLSLALYAVYVFLTGELSRKLGPSRLATLSNLATAAVVVVVVGVQVRLSGQDAVMIAPRVSTSALGWVVLMVAVSTVLPYFLMMEGIHRLGAAEASLISMAGPTVTVAASWLVLAEQLTGLQLVGCALTLLGVAWTQKKSKAAPEVASPAQRQSASS